MPAKACQPVLPKSGSAAVRLRVGLAAVRLRVGLAAVRLRAGLHARAFVANGCCMPGPAKALLTVWPFLLAPLLLAGCGATDSTEQPLQVDAVEDRAARLLVADAVSEGLTARDAAGLVVPGVAQSWRVSDDGLSIVFRLRNAKFVGGRPITAADAVASIQRARSGRAGPQVRDLLLGVTAVTAPLDDVVEIRLSTPQPEILELLAMPALAVRRGGTRETAGAFLAGAEPAAEGAAAPPPGATRLTRNPGFHAVDTVALSAATVRAQQAEAAIRRFNRGETDLVFGGALDGLASARVTARREALILEQPRAALLLLVNHRRPALGDQRVRRALALGIDRAALGQRMFGSQAAAEVRALAPANIAGYTPPEAGWATQPFVGRQEDARRLLAEAGIDGVATRLELTVAISDSDAEARLMDLVGQDLAALGITLRLARRDPAQHRRAIAQADFDLALLRRDTPVDSPLPFLIPYLCDRNRHGVCLPEADRLLADSWKAPTRSARLAALASAERLWAEDGAAIGLVQPLGWSLVSPRITGFAANPSGSHALRHLSFAPSRRRLP
jgi:oligopeptide transport system substrate-binding protein